jgi:hypothetical protein
MPSPFGRFDTEALHDALDVKRAGNGLSWAGLARQLRVAASTLTRAQAGGWMAGDNAAMFVDWLGVPHEAFLRSPGAGSAPDLPTQLAHVLHIQTEVPVDRAQGLYRSRLDHVEGFGLSSETAPRSLGLPAPLIDYRTIKARTSPDFFTRIDSVALGAALSEARVARGLTWQQVADEIDQPSVVSASSIAGIGGRPSPNDRARRDLGARTGAHQLMAVVQWLAVPSEIFMSRPPGRRAASLRQQLLALVVLRRDLPAGVLRTLEGAIEGLEWPSSASSA